MKKIITLLVFCFAGGMVMAQTPALKVAENGNVGIGVSDPSASLHVRGSGAAFEPSAGTTVNFQGINEDLRFQFQSWLNTTQSWSYFTLFGSEESINAGARRGEVGFFGQYHQFNVGVTGGSDGGLTPFGSAAMRITSDAKLAVGGTSVPAAHIASFNGTILVNGTTVGSDRKLKSNIREFNYGLNEVLRMAPRFYNYNGDIVANDGIKAGIIAQEFQKIIPEAVVEVDYQKHDANNLVIDEGSYLAVNTDMIRYALVNAVQEQQDMIDDLRKENEELRELITSIADRLENTDQSSTSATLTGNEKIASLEQNNPNPFTNQTSISYFVPSNAQSASIAITSATGQILKTVSISDRGQGVLDLKADNLPQGTYQYTLVVDGKTVKTNKMILAQ